MLQPGRRTHIDHSHATGQVRALLCGPCNQMIGLAQDSPMTLLAGAEYLRAFERRDQLTIRASRTD
jgi:hypothetical protein